ncbi:hypothetical protein N7493_004881 [Penicillium malachiteum]|uniref:Uncharacterized protein n=1 Tax=Penicillium malachiteum TaxID=1324776 RepID=A0AAD6MW09_9EURO|nr:hypothetical protein N7493_004881 [Penicillium malachiteum]
MASPSQVELSRGASLCHFSSFSSSCYSQQFHSYQSLLGPRLTLPRWYISHDRANEAVQIIADLEEKEVDDPFMSEIHYSVEYEKKNSVRFSDILHGRAHEKAGTKTIRRLILGMGAQGMQQFSGINVTSYCLTTVLTTSVGLNESLARLLTACDSVQYLLFSLIGIPNIER